MIESAIVFGMRLALCLTAAAVVFAFSRSYGRWLGSDCKRVDNADRLGAGVFLLGCGSIFTGINQMMTLLFGHVILGDYVSAVVASVIGVGLLLSGYFLAFTAWLSTAKNIPVRGVALACFAAATVVSLLGMGVFYALGG